MNTDESLKTEFYKLFSEKLDEIAQNYDERRFQGVKLETAKIEDSLKEEVKESFNKILFGEDDP